MFNIEEELKKLPAKPGVYLMHDKKDAIIYVLGKRSASRTACDSIFKAAVVLHQRFSR